MMGKQRLITVHDPVELAAPDVQQQAMHGNLGPDERAVADEVAGFDDVRPFAAEHAEKFAQVRGQMAAVQAEFLETVQQHGGGHPADLAIGVADDGDLATALHGAGEREGTHGAGERTGDDVAGVAEPDELVGRQAQRVREEGVQARVDAGEGDDGQRVRELRRVQPRAHVPGHGPVVRFDDGFKQVHRVIAAKIVWIEPKIDATYQPYLKHPQLHLDNH